MEANGAQTIGCKRMIGMTDDEVTALRGTLMWRGRPHADLDTRMPGWKRSRGMGTRLI